MIRRLVVLLALMVVISCTHSRTTREVPANRGPEVIDLKMGEMTLKFEHWKHQSSAHNECYNCHRTKIGVIDGWSKETAHKTCIPCHDLESKGPVACHQCHIK